MKTKLKLIVVLVIVCWFGGDSVVAQQGAQQADGSRWWKGNLHTHSLWSDGDDFPEMITKWYSDHDYHFLALTDHNVLSRGKRWMNLSKIEQRGGKAAIQKYVAAFGEDWVEMRDKPKSNQEKSESKPADESKPTEKPAKDSGQTEIAERQVRLRPLDEFRGKFEVPGKFLMLEGEEISDRAEGFPIHLNATNLRTVISPVGGATVQEAINNNVRAVQEQAEKNGEPILVHLNHPNFGWAVTAEELAAVTNERFFEVYNGHPGINSLGDATRPSVAKLWDIANTIRIDQLKSHPVFGLANDDSHQYHGKPGSGTAFGDRGHPGRGWIMVRSKELTAESLIAAMNLGEFYSSSGVELESVEFNRDQNSLTLKIKPQPGVTYSTQFIGTKSDYERESTAQLTAEGKPIRATRVYSKDVGEVLATSDSLQPTYQLQGDELFVRAVVTSSREHPDPSYKDEHEQAWTQPMGWENQVR